MLHYHLPYLFLKLRQVPMLLTKPNDKPGTSDQESFQPLAARMRPRSLSEYIGQGHLLGECKPLRRAIEQGILHSMILWGPPGTGKTTLANLIAQQSGAFFQSLSAVFSGVKDIRIIVNEAKI